MGDWNTVTTGRPSMGRVRPLLMAVAVQRRGEHIQGGPGAIPNVGQGAHGRGGVARNDRGRVPGNHGGHIFLGRGRSLLTQARLPPPHKRLVYHIPSGGNLAPNLVV